MGHKRTLLLVILVVLALLLPLMAFAQSSSSLDSAETLQEQARAWAAEHEEIAALVSVTELSLLGGQYPLLVGVDNANIPAYQIDPLTNTNIPAFSGAQVWGAAYDAANELVYFNSGATLYEWPVGGTINQLGTIVDAGGATQSMVSLAFYNGVLYGTKNIATEAVWIIDPVTLVATIHIIYPTTHDMGGLAIDPNTGEFYATDDGTLDSLVRINADGTVTAIAPYPAGQTDIDGLAISDDGYAYLVIDEPGFIYVYDFNAGAYTTPLDSPWTTSEIFSAGAWISEPAICNTDPITINDASAATPYPSTISVSGLDTAVTDIDIHLLGLNHAAPDDIDMLLVSPEGENLVIMSDAGGNLAVTNVDLVLDDAAASPLPDNTQIISGTYQPTNYGPGDVFDPPAPSPSAATTLATFNGTNPNGDWSLYVMDDTAGEAGQLMGGWCVEITAIPDEVELAVAHLAPFAMDPGTAVTVTLNTTPVLTDFVYGDSTPYLTVPGGVYDVAVIPAGSPTPAISGTFTLTAGTDYSVIAIGDGVNQPLELLALVDDNSAPASGNFKIRLGHLAPFAAGNATADVRLQDGTPVLTDLNFGEVVPYLELPAGTYDLKVTTPGGAVTLIDPLPTTFSDGDIVSAFATGDGSNQALGAFAWPSDAVGFFLPLAPAIHVDPPEFVISQIITSVMTYTLNISNTGAGDLDWTIDEAAPVVAVMEHGTTQLIPGNTAAGGGMDLVSELGAPLPTGLRPVMSAGGDVDCDAEPGIIIHDDDTIENGYSGNPAAGITEVRFVDLFTPSSYPTSFRALCLAFISLGPSSLNFDIVVYDDDGPGGEPGTELGVLAATAVVPVVTPPLPPDYEPTWNSYDISSLGLSITSGSVYIGVRYAPSTPNVFISADQTTTTPLAGGYWWNNNANVWAPIQSAFAAYRSLFVRAVEGEPTGCDAPSDIPWLSLSDISGTTAGGDSSEVMVTVDTTGLTAGNTYTGTLCINSNDPVAPLVTVPVTLTVEAVSYGVLLSGDQAGSGSPGETIGYVVTITNTGNITDTFDLSAAGIWAATLSQTSVTLAAGTNGTFTVEVEIDSSALDGEMDVTTVTAVSQTDPGATDSMTLTTTAVISQQFIYLPVILKP